MAITGIVRALALSRIDAMPTIEWTNPVLHRGQPLVLPVDRIAVRPRHLSARPVLAGLGVAVCVLARAAALRGKRRIHRLSTRLRPYRPVSVDTPRPWRADQRLSRASRHVPSL
ncbi:hypothetical protein EF294_19715 [Gordonia oryzae]|uniref:Uncharacterized protein n=1 Tax=Gordonia oryzae TaxID=2487349 RepID=A0A3N4G956_9ACTN|nr:hypothetical protein [Gordonia oryzae]RPA57096.1 hypothetical protein EF294_19715 [Gordonia oryzae]